MRRKRISTVYAWVEARDPDFWQTSGASTPDASATEHNDKYKTPNKHKVGIKFFQQAQTKSAGQTISVRHQSVIPT